MIAAMSLDQLFVTGLIIVFVIGVLRRSFRAIVGLGILWLIAYWPLMFLGAMVGDMASKYEATVATSPESFVSSESDSQMWDTGEPNLE